MRRLQVAVALNFMIAAVGAATALAPGLSEVDRAFITKAAEEGLMEVSAGRLATQRGLDPAVKEFGQKMVADHTAAGEKLKSLADSKQLVLPDLMSVDQSAALRKLEVLVGSDFDKTYTRMMIKDHTEDISEFEKEVKKGQDPDVKSFAQDTLPTLHRHLTLASTLQEKK